MKYSTDGIPKNPLEQYQTAHLQQENGVIYDKKPFKLELVEGMYINVHDA